MDTQPKTNLGNMLYNCQRNRWISGIALMLIGGLILAGQAIKSNWSGLLFLPALGILILLWGISTRSMGLLIPGGILSGIGLGTFLIQAPFVDKNPDTAGGVFLLSLGLGFALITVLSAFFACGPRWWPLIPGAILSLYGAALLIQGPAGEIAYHVGQYWPLGLIAFGLYMLLRRQKA